MISGSTNSDPAKDRQPKGRVTLGSLIFGGEVVLAAFLVGTVLFVGFSYLIAGVRTEVQDVVYFEFPYLSYGFKCIGIGLLAILLVAYTKYRRSTRYVAPLASIAISLVFLVKAASLRPESQLLRVECRPLGSAHNSLEDFYRVHGNYPANETQLRCALNVPPGTASPFSRKGKVLPYTVHVTVGASQPSLDQLPSSPGTLTYTVKTDLSQYWLAVTSLDRPVGGRVRIAGSGEPWIVVGKAQIGKMQ